MRTAPLPAAVAAIALAIALATLRAPAQQPATPTDPIAIGAALATKGAGAVTPCSSCHGANGEGNAAARFPRLVGQSAAYLQRQLDAYAGGSRANPVMEPIAKAMSPEQRAAAAAYYESLAPSATAAAAASRPANAPPLGRTIATVGIEARGVQACANCHGPEGIGEWAIYPALAGQHASYLETALAEWKSGARKTDPSGQMPRIAQALSDTEASAVVAYYAALPAPPLPRASAAATANANAQRGGQAVVSGPTSAGAPAAAQGVGTEQGAPLSGGTQGVGGPGNATGPQSGAPQGTTPARAASATR
jgi:cytochrome c553